MNVYLDNNATTALDERVLQVMLPIMRHTGNASSGHSAGRWAHEAVEAARRKVADLLSASPREVVFTSGATEANNIAIKGICAAAEGRRGRIVSCTTEHPAVLEPLRALSRVGVDIHLVPVNRSGAVDLDEVRAAVTPDTFLVTIMAANNETGVLAPLAEIADIAHRVGALFHSDATQLAPWGVLDVDELGVDMLALSAHKMHGPQGVGALFIRRDSPLIQPLFDGGGHERGLRSGTLNTAGIAGLGAAAEVAAAEGYAARDRVIELRDRLHRLFSEFASPVVLNGHPTDRLPGTVNLAFPGADADAVMTDAPTVAIATGSACSTGVPAPSHVLTAMGVPADLAESSLRFGLSRFTSREEVEFAADVLAASVQKFRAHRGRLVAQ